MRSTTKPWQCVALMCGLMHAQTLPAQGASTQGAACVATQPGSAAGAQSGGVLGALLGASGAGTAGAATAGAWHDAIAGGMASDDPTPANCVPGEPASVAQQLPPALAGNPVSVLTGAKLDRSIDVHLPSTSASAGGSAELVVSRLYASSGAGSAALGPGWRLGFDTRLYASRVGGQAVPEIVQGDGRHIRFAPTRDSSGGTGSHGQGERLLRHAALAPGDGVLDRLPRPASAREHWRWRWPDGRELYFDADGRLRRIASAGAATIRLGYDGAGRLVEVASSAARRLRFRYQAHAPGRLASVSDDGGVRVRYAYDAQDRLSLATYADGARMRYRYEGELSARLAAVALPDGTESEYRYDERGRVAYSRAAGEGESRALHFRYEGIGDHAPDGRTIVSRGGQERARYHWSARPVASTPDSPSRRLDWSQGIGCDRCPATGWRYAYSNAGELETLERAGARLRVERDRDGAQVSLAWRDGGARRVSLARSRQVRASARASARGDALATHSIVLPDGDRVRRSFDSRGRVVAIDGPASASVLRGWDDNDRLLFEGRADGSSARFDYDAAARATRFVERSSSGIEAETSLAWAGVHLVAVDHPEQSERYERDDAGRVVARHLQLRLESGDRTAFTLRYLYDDAGRLVAWSLPAGGWVHAVRALDGQVVALDWQAREGGWREPLVWALERDRFGLRRGVLGNRIVVQSSRDAVGTLRARRDRLVPRLRVRSVERVHAIDHDLDFDHAGRLRAWRRGDESRRHLHDDHGQLVQAVHGSPRAEATWRYAYDANGNRVHASQPDRLGKSTGRPALRHDVMGRAVRDGSREYLWDAAGRLAEVRQAGRTLASYRYDHRGLRITKRVATPAGDQITHFVYDAQRQLLAELDARGSVQRQYIHLADRPVAVLDRVDAAAGRPAQFALRFLHLNHLGAPEAASDERGRVIWRADYAPFGRRLASESHAQAGARHAFDLALRLPGQYEDAETGLHYNDHRYYDPDSGRYLSPDPLGLAAGSNVYAYAGNNPLAQVDPSGLLLFAFDGTDNSDTPPRRDDWSNVYKLARSYADGRVWYMAGVGQDDAASGILATRGDAITAASARSRVDQLLGELDATAAVTAASGGWLDVDILGFSRGAAMARDFSNRVADRIRAGEYARLGACVRLRFLGLWDTVAQFGPQGMANAAWKLAIPGEVGYSAHAVALNEHRVLFPLESIVGSPLAGVRIERGFVGAHSDIGGSYAEGDLSDVTLVWMHEQARVAGLRMFALTSEYARVSAPLLHDSTLGRASDREVLYRNSFGWVVANPLQRVARIDGLQWRETAPFIRRYATPQNDVYGQPTLAGLVDIVGYSNWLDANYAIRVSAAP